jgi:hypothetical protein
MTNHPTDLALARSRFAAAQTRLLAALVAGAPPPPLFDPARIAIQADALIAKRRQLVARLRPDLVETTGADFPTRFNAYARANPRPTAGARADAEAFAHISCPTSRIATRSDTTPDPHVRVLASGLYQTAVAHGVE